MYNKPVIISISDIDISREPGIKRCDSDGTVCALAGHDVSNNYVSPEKLGSQ